MKEVEQGIWREKFVSDIGRIIPLHVIESL